MVRFNFDSFPKWVQNANNTVKGRNFLYGIFVHEFIALQIKLSKERIGPLSPKKSMYYSVHLHVIKKDFMNTMKYMYDQYMKSNQNNWENFLHTHYLQENEVCLNVFDKSYLTF